MTSWKVPFIDYPDSSLMLPVLCHPKKSYQSCKIPLTYTLAELLASLESSSSAPDSPSPSLAILEEGDLSTQELKRLSESAVVDLSPTVEESYAITEPSSTASSSPSPSIEILEETDSSIQELETPSELAKVDTSPTVEEGSVVINTPTSSIEPEEILDTAPISKTSTIKNGASIILKGLIRVVIFIITAFIIFIIFFFIIDSEEQRESISLEPKISQEEVKQGICTDGRLSAVQIIELAENNTAYGTKLSKNGKKEYNWKEYQGPDGSAFFEKQGKPYIPGKWKVESKGENAVICWCYGDCLSYQCKYVESQNNCSTWSYINSETEETTGIVNKWGDGDLTN